MDVEGLLKRLTIKDLRVQCRQRKITPAGSKEELTERLKEHMQSTGDFALRNEDGTIMPDDKASQLFGVSVLPANLNPGNNYSRPDGQNVGNFLGDRPSSRVLAAPGGNSSFAFGDGAPAATHAPPRGPPAPQPSEPAPQAAPPASAKSSFLDSMTAKIAGRSGVAYSPAKARHAAPETPQSPQENVSAATNAAAPPAAAPSPTAIGVNDNNYSRPAGQNVGNFLTDKPSSRVLAPPGGASTFRFC